MKICKECGKPYNECVMHIIMKEFKRRLDEDMFGDVLKECQKHKKFMKDLDRICKED